MTRPATYARIAFYGDGKPDPRTATCEQHRCAGPTSETARGDGVEIPESHDWPCVICPGPLADVIGTLVISTVYSDSYVYGGPDWRTGGASLTFRAGGGGEAVIRCSPELIAPAGTLNEKDPRIRVEKLPRKRSGRDAGVWLSHVDDPRFAVSGWAARRTRRSAVNFAARQLAVAEHQASLAGRVEATTAAEVPGA